MKIKSAIVLITFGFLMAGCRAAADNSVVGPGMAGDWRGNAQVIVSWCKQTNLPVALVIKEDGSVTGKVGDAVLHKGQLKRNRGAIGRRLNIKTDYLIAGDLAGPIVSAEGITRSGVMMPLNWSEKGYVGGLHTTGAKFGGKTKMVLSARLSLEKQPEK